MRTAVRAALKAGAGRERPAAQPLPRLPTHLQLADARRWRGAQAGGAGLALPGAQSIAAGAQGRQGVQSGNKNTAFKWRHRFLKAQNQSEDWSLAGIVEVDEIFDWRASKASASCRGAARKRGGVAEKPGLSAEQIPVDRPDRAGAQSTRCCRNSIEVAVRRGPGQAIEGRYVANAWMATRRSSPSPRPKASNMS